MPTPKPLTLCVETFDDEAGYVAWIDNEKFKGMVVQSSSLKGALEELLISLNVKFAYDYGISIGGVEEKINALMKESSSMEGHGKRELNLMFS